MSESFFEKQIGAWKSRGDGTSSRVLAANGDVMAEKAGPVLSVLIEQTSGPEEALVILLTLAEFIKKESGIKHVEIMEHPSV